ncbi:helix-turn-helix domain-containing protein [Streptomyces rugosispiralis]|uniref:Helix-turn-helix domain-containing protein n=1 Tax=Streptomyces rugosispiralis TaxID=2967341 RepID=A0ABT1VBI2_9ACTN|nr:helix-turn-helix transcriptional regulator [Streptomyces rugosispiralis]MCQ8194632.1 helix-turn-helix domain-containing protein [Streptomyces rugosispiralis]
MDLPPSPAQIPRGLLSDPVFVRALADRDFATVLATTHGSGISFNRISEACGIKADRISKVARGEATVTALDTIERIADGLRIPGAFLGLAQRPWEHTSPTPSTESDDGDDPMKRRHILRGALAAGLTGPALTALTSTRQSLDQALAAETPADLSDLEAAAETYGYGYGGQPPTRVLADLVTDFAGIRSLLHTPQPVTTRTRLCRAAGQMAGMAAIVLHDLGARKEARGWFATAGRAARESGDRQLCAWVLAREAMVPLNYGAPRAAASLAEEARHVAGSRPTAAATLAAAVAARAYALSHKPDQAREALTAADQFMERLDGSERADTWLTHGDQKHHVHLSHAFTALGDTHRARESQEQALKLSAPTSSMTRTLLKIDGAACAHHDGDTEQACHRATAALTALPADYRTGLVRKRAMDLYRSIPAQHHQENAMRELRNILAM